jgi:hypothetical protein
LLNGTGYFTFRDSDGFEKPSTHGSKNPVAIKLLLMKRRWGHLAEYDADRIPEQHRIAVRRLAVVAAFTATPPC